MAFRFTFATPYACEERKRLRGKLHHLGQRQKPSAGIFFTFIALMLLAVTIAVGAGPSPCVESKLASCAA